MLCVAALLRAAWHLVTWAFEVQMEACYICWCHSTLPQSVSPSKVCMQLALLASCYFIHTALSP